MRKKVKCLPESSARECSEFSPRPSLKIAVKDELTWRQSVYLEKTELVSLGGGGGGGAAGGGGDPTTKNW